VKFSKIMAVLCLACVCCMLPVAAQNSRADESSLTLTEASDAPQQGRTDETAFRITDSGGQQPAAPGRFSTVWILIRMVLVLAFVLACVYAVIYFMRQGMKTGTDTDPFLRRVSSLSLSPGKSVQIVTLLDNAYLIGVTDNSINLIGQVSDKELVDAMNLYADRTAKNDKPRTFNDILSLFMNSSSSGKTIFSGSAKTASDLLKKQRERLHDNGDEHESE